MVAERPFLETWLGGASFLSHEGGKLSIGYPTEMAFFKESIQKQTEDICKTLSRLAGQRVDLQIELRDDLEAPNLVAAEETEEHPPSSESAAPEPEVEESPTPAEAVEEDPVPPPTEDFYNDPLIQKALKLFEGTLLNPNPSS